MKKGDEIKKILEKKDDYYHLNLLKKLIYVGYVSVSGSKSGRYNTYSFNLDNVKKVYSNEWINNISKLILNTNDRFFKMALIVLKMQIEEIQYKDPDIHSYSAAQINSYCKENNIDFVASDDGWEHL